MINAHSMSVQVEGNPEKLFRAGMALLRQERPRDAVLAFEHALKLSPGQPAYMSYLGLSMALCRVRPKDALDLCRRAVNASVYHPEFFHNLGQVYLMSGNRQRAREVFLKGLELDRRDHALRGEIIAMGVRRPPLIPFLPRNSRINVTLGRTLKRLKIR
jgi:tetratricopeptide (TPR) repeat protein